MFPFNSGNSYILVQLECTISCSTETCPSSVFMFVTFCRDVEGVEVGGGRGYYESCPPSLVPYALIKFSDGNTVDSHVMDLHANI